MIIPNVAIGGEATQSSTYSLYIPQLAIVGNCRESQGGFACTNEEPGAWWQVDLKNQFEIKKVAVKTRKIS